MPLRHPDKWSAFPMRFPGVCGRGKPARKGMVERDALIGGLTLHVGPGYNYNYIRYFPAKNFPVIILWTTVASLETMVLARA